MIRNWGNWIGSGCLEEIEFGKSFDYLFFFFLFLGINLEGVFQREKTNEKSRDIFDAGFFVCYRKLRACCLGFGFC